MYADPFDNFKTSEHMATKPGSWNFKYGFM